VDTELKTLALELKDGDDAGSFAATFATLNVVDHHGDVTLPGAFKSGDEVLVGAYQHDIFSLPVGKGVIHADEDRAWVEGKFNLATTGGRDTYEAVKDAGSLMEWSYVFVPKSTETGDFTEAEGEEPKRVRFLKEIDVWSVDPVLKGAGIGTATEMVKSAQPIQEQAASVIEAIDGLTTRLEKRAADRAAQGRTLGNDGLAKATELVTSLAALKARLEDLLAGPPDDSQTAPVDLAKARLEYLRASAQLSGALGS
jgi:phage head maturation protease